MTKKEKACKDMADVCELAHNRTVRECKKLGIKKIDAIDDDGNTIYPKRVQKIFDHHYDHIIEVTGL